MMGFFRRNKQKTPEIVFDKSRGFFVMELDGFEPTTLRLPA